MRGRHRIQLWLALAFGMLVECASLGAQGVTVVDPVPSCRKCIITLQPVVTIGRTEDDVSITMFSSLERDGRGDYYVAPTAAIGEIAVYGRDGTYRRSVGRAGGGPGELSAIRGVRILDDDSLLVLDDRGLTLLLTNGRYVRGRRLAGGLNTFRFAVLSDGRVLLNNYGRGERCFVLLDREYRLVRSFGVQLEGVPPDFDRMQYQMVATAHGEIIASQMSYRHVIEVWDSTGALRRRMVEDPEWFRPWAARQPTVEGVFEPRPHVVSSYYDARGRLWVATIVPDARWRSVTHSMRPGRIVPESLRTRVFDTVLEVLDLNTASVIAVARFDGLANQFLANGFLYGRREDSSGALQFEVFRPVLRGQ